MLGIGSLVRGVFAAHAPSLGGFLMFAGGMCLPLRMALLRRLEPDRSSLSVVKFCLASRNVALDVFFFSGQAWQSPL